MVINGPVVVRSSITFVSVSACSLEMSTAGAVYASGAINVLDRLLITGLSVDIRSTFVLVFVAATYTQVA